MKKLGLALLVIVVVTGVVVAATQWRERTRQKREIADVKEAYLALAMYRSDYGQFPARLSDLVPNYLSEEAHLRAASFQYSPQTPDRLLIRPRVVARADGSAGLN